MLTCKESKFSTGITKSGRTILYYGGAILDVPLEHTRNVPEFHVNPTMFKIQRVHVIFFSCPDCFIGVIDHHHTLTISSKDDQFHISKSSSIRVFCLGFSFSTWWWLCYWRAPKKGGFSMWVVFPSNLIEIGQMFVAEKQSTGKFR